MGISDARRPGLCARRRLPANSVVLSGRALLPGKAGTQGQHGHGDHAPASSALEDCACAALKSARPTASGTWMVVVSEAVRVSPLVSEIVAEVVASGPLLAVTVNQAEPSAPGRWLPRFQVSTPPDRGDAARGRDEGRVARHRWRSTSLAARRRSRCCSSGSCR